MAWDKDLGDEPEPALRDRAPDILSPIDEAAPVSGHHPLPEPPAEGAAALMASRAPEHDWTAAASRLWPVLRPKGSGGTPLADLDTERLAFEGLKPHAQPVVDDGPGGTMIAYAIREEAFDILVNADHLLAWGASPDALRAAAMENLGLWSASAPWTDEVSGERRLLSSGTGDGGDAARVLLPEVRSYLAAELGRGARVVVGIPERDLLVAGALHADDLEFAALFAEFIREDADGCDEPIDRRVFELVDGSLKVFEG